MIKFKGTNCELDKKYYGNGRIAIVLINAITQTTQCVATVNLPDIHLEADEVCIKDYAENIGVLKALVNEKIISEPIRFTQSGYVNIPICKLLKQDI